MCNGFVEPKPDAGRRVSCLSISDSTTYNGIFFRYHPTTSTPLPSIQSLGRGTGWS